jgi:hypothetical protein
VAPRFLSLLDAVANPLCGIASGTHRKSGVLFLTSNASPVESYLLPSAYSLFTPRREELQGVSNRSRSYGVKGWRRCSRLKLTMPSRRTRWCSRPSDQEESWCGLFQLTPGSNWCFSLAYSRAVQVGLYAQAMASASSWSSSGLTLARQLPCDRPPRNLRHPIAIFGTPLIESCAFLPLWIVHS